MNRLSEADLLHVHVRVQGLDHFALFPISGLCRIPGRGLRGVPPETVRSPERQRRIAVGIILSRCGCIDRPSRGVDGQGVINATLVTGEPTDGHCLAASFFSPSGIGRRGLGPPMAETRWVILSR